MAEIKLKYRWTLKEIEKKFRQDDKVLFWIFFGSWASLNVLAIWWWPFAVARGLFGVATLAAGVCYLVRRIPDWIAMSNGEWKSDD